MHKVCRGGNVNRISTKTLLKLYEIDSENRKTLLLGTDPNLRWAPQKTDNSRRWGR
jgi:hypothetical protein